MVIVLSKARKIKTAVLGELTTGHYLSLCIITRHLFFDGQKSLNWLFAGQVCSILPKTEGFCLES